MRRVQTGSFVYYEEKVRKLYHCLTHEAMLFPLLGVGVLRLMFVGVMCVEVVCVGSVWGPGVTGAPETIAAETEAAVGSRRTVEAGTEGDGLHSTAPTIYT